MTDLLPPPHPAPFQGLRIAHGAGVLAPRPWTTLQSAWGRALLDGLPPGPVLELCCGAGQIGLGAVVGTTRRLVLVDLCPRACAWAHHNVVANGLSERVEVRRGDIAEALLPYECFALVVADPPYLPSAEVAEWPDDPPVAIDGGPDGLDHGRVALATASRHLLDGGSLLLQARGADQLRRLGPDATAAGLVLAEVRDDGPDRAVGRFEASADRVA